MKKLFFLVVAALLILPGVVLAQGETLSRANISRISNGVVLILTLDANGQPLKSGSGTIIDANGDIYTNRHVVEGGSDYAVLTLTDLGEQAQLAYFASPTLVHQDVDFAVLQIDRDANSRTINAATLNLPFISMASTLPEIGDRIFVFGYPDLGDAHLVMTSGSITTIENDTLNNQRIPYWYQTDAQISPGNSGGLVVNANGEMVGIPTLVRSEERTLGRLGAILSLSAIRGALDSELGQSVPTPAPGIATQPPKNTQGTLDQQLSIQITNVEHNFTYNDVVGMMIHTSAEAIGYLNMPLRAAIFAFWEDGSAVPANNRAPDDDRTVDGQLTVQQVVTPNFDDTVWDDMWFFIPYDIFPEGNTGTFPAFLEAQFGVDGGEFTAFSDDVTFDYTYPDQQMIVDITNVEHNVQMNGMTGMQVHTHINTLGFRGQDLRVALFVYWKDGTPIPGANAPVDNQTTSGYLTVQDVITPSYDDSEWSDFWFFLPYDYFPTGLKGDQEAFAEVEIGLDGQDFNSWSLEAPFTLNYN